jgi:hypothetical protein
MAQTPDDKTVKVTPASAVADAHADAAAAEARTPEVTAKAVEKSDVEKAEEPRNEAMGERRKGVEHTAPKGGNTLYSDRLLTPEDPEQVVGISGGTKVPDVAAKK